MNMIKFGVLALSLVLVTACGKKEEAAAPAEPATAAAPAAETAPAPEAAPVAENATMPAPADGAMSNAPAVDEALKPQSAVVPVCPTGCIYSSCPPPNGPKACCSQTGKICLVP